MARRAPAAVGFTGRTRPAARAVAPAIAKKNKDEKPPSFGEAEAPPPLAAAPPSRLRALCPPLPPCAASRAACGGLRRGPTAAVKKDKGAARYLLRPSPIIFWVVGVKG